MSIRSSLLILAFIALLSVGLGGYYLTTHSSDTAWKVARDHTDKTAEMIRHEVNFHLLSQQRSSQALALMPQVRGGFDDGRSFTHAEVTGALREFCASQSASLCYLLDAKGVTIASSDEGLPNSILGQDFRFRPYFQEAIGGRPAVYLALGVTTKKRGFYFSSPIGSDGQGGARGVAVVKYPVEALEREFADLAGTFALVDTLGMVFASNRQDWLFRSLSELSGEDARTIMRTRQFGEAKPTSVGLIETSDRRLVAPDGSHYLFARGRLVAPEGWSVAYLYDAKNAATILDGGAAGAPLKAIFLGLFLTIGGVVAFLYRRASREMACRRMVEIDLRQSEEKYRLLFEKSEDPMWVIYDGAFMMANRSAARILGYDSPDELRRIHPSECSPQVQDDGEDSRVKADRMIATAYATGFHRFEWTHRKRDGEAFPVEVSLTRIPFEHHDALYCVWRDISEQKQAQRALERARAGAEEANRAKSEFLSSMSHEIRTPMTGVLGFADMLLDDELPPDSREKVVQIKSATHALLRLLNDILDMSKLEAGKMEVECIDFHLRGLVDDVVLLFKRSRPVDHPVTLRLELAAAVPAAVRSDPTRLRQILVNLVGNALKFTRAGSVTVRGDVLAGDDGCPRLRFAVSDSGIGMSAATMASLFTEFTQADASISRRYEGSGLGLAICRRLVTLLGGDIGVDSREGQGSTFWFTIPCVPAEADVGPAGMRAEPTQYRTSRALEILVAEDNPVNQVILKKLMEKHGHRVVLAHDGAAAVALHQAADFDAILMDVRMPGLSGPEAARLIRQMPGERARVPIIAVTADAMKGHFAEFLAAGMDRCIAKPINRAELLQAINEALDEEIHVPVEVS